MARLYNLFPMLLGLSCYSVAAYASASVTDSVRAAGKDSIIAIEKVEIGRRGDVDIVPVQHLGEAELSRVTGQSVATALRHFSGSLIKDYGGIGGLKSVDIRSMGSQHVGISYDGVLMGNAQNGIVDLGRLSLDGITRISVYHGHRSSVFESARTYSLGSLVGLQSEIPQWDNGRSFRLRTSFKVGSFGSYQPGVSYEQRLGRRMVFRVSGEVLEAHGRYPFRVVGYNALGQKAYDTTAVRKNGDVHIQRLEGAVYGRLDDGEWRLRLYGYHSRRGLPGAILTNVWGSGERLRDRNYFVQGMWQKRFAVWYRGKVIGKLAHDYMHYEQQDPAFIRNRISYWQTEAYLSTVHGFRLGNWGESSVAYDVVWNRLQTRHHTNVQSTLNNLHPTRWLHYIAGSVSLHYKALHFMTNWVEVLAEQRVAHGDKKHLQGYALPSFFLSYRPNLWGMLSFHAYYKHSLRLPTFNDLYYTDWGNVYLRPERAKQASVGMRWEWDTPPHFLQKLGVSLDAYQNWVTDKIIAYPTRGQFRWSMINLGKVHMWGCEIALWNSWQLRWADVLGIRLQYSYSRAIDVSSPESRYYRHQIPYIPWHSGSAVVSYRYKYLSLAYNFLYTGERYHRPENSIYNYEPAWYTSDLVVGWEYPIFTFVFLTRLEVNNLWDQAYAVVLNYPMPGRNYCLTLQITF